MITLCMRIACWIPKATSAHTLCVILIAFSLQQWLHERISILRYVYIACPVQYSLFMATNGTCEFSTTKQKRCPLYGELRLSDIWDEAGGLAGVTSTPRAGHFYISKLCLY